MYKYLILFSAILFLALSSRSQPFIARNSIYAEFGGNGLFYSLNYERILFQTEKVSYALRGGAAYTPEWVNGVAVLTVPFEFNFIFGQKKSHFELGLGYTIVRQYYNSDTKKGPMFLARIGYRYQKHSKGLMYRIAFTPFNDLMVEFGWSDMIIQPLIGGSIGYSF